MSRWAAVRRAIGAFVEERAELSERMWLLNNPWEEDYLHWVGAGDDRRLHGSVPPPADGRRHSVTREGWCRGLAQDEARHRAGPGLFE